VPGDVYGYSHNPYYGKHSGYHVLIAPILYAYELTEDKEFLKHGRAMYQQLIRGKNVNVVNNCYWNTPTDALVFEAFWAGVRRWYDKSSLTSE